MVGSILPDDVLAEILSWMPLKSLSRFKCISRQWRRLISDPPRVIPKTPHAGIVCQSLYLGGHVVFLDVDDKGNASVHHSISGDWLLLDSCNGFLLFYRGSHQEEDYAVYNPITKHSISFIPPTVRATDRVGLACDGSFFSVICFHQTPGGDFQFDVYSSGNREWRKKTLASPFNYAVESRSCNGRSLFLKGAIHWTWWKWLLIYHLEDEYCKLVALPDSGDISFLEALDKCIWFSEECLHYCLVSNDRISIWVLHIEGQMYGPNHQDYEWRRKHIAILPTCLSPPEHYPYVVSPVSANDSFGTLFIRFAGGVLSYNPATGRHLEPHLIASSFFFLGIGQNGEGLKKRGLISREEHGIW
ncbi:hypothetical protein ACLOJK_041944 [Asimina triloba]